VVTTVASAHSATTAGATKITIKLTAAGYRLLKGLGSERVRGTATFGYTVGGIRYRLSVSGHLTLR
jgi:hypothetical protein